MKGEKAIVGQRCWDCGYQFGAEDTWFYYYHGDQDDRVCEECAKKLVHNDTVLRGMNVYETA